MLIYKVLLDQDDFKEMPDLVDFIVLFLEKM